MNGQAWLEAWKARAQRRREALTNYLSRKPANPAVATFKERYVKRLETTVNNRKAFAHAYQQHVQELAKALAGQPSTVTSSGPSPKGSLGET